MTASIPVIDTVAGATEAVSEARGRGATVGLVPTMGALHEGHLSLIRAARADNDVVVVSIYVNPTQFGPGEDFGDYPRDLPRDRVLASRAGADLIFSPSTKEMYADDHCTWVEVEGPTSGLCGRSRPGHFRGVCTVVAKLFGICRPDRAYFGEKDAQQLVVIKRMARDLNCDVEIVSCPTAREEDGLAMSSRNARLTKEQRAQAPTLYRALEAARGAANQGERDAAVLKVLVRAVLAEAPLGDVDYVEIVDAEDLTPQTTVAGRSLIAVSVRFGEVRLIDNISVSV
jgi:pantoate--beta-alanine ligase